MYQHTRLIWVLATLLWATAAYAQSEMAPGFGSDVMRITGRVWALVGAFCFLGILVRIAVELQERTIRRGKWETFIDLGVIVGTGTLSGFIAFATLEFVSETSRNLTGHKLPDLLICVSIWAASFNKRTILDAFSARLKRNIESIDVTKR